MSKPAPKSSGALGKSGNSGPGGSKLPPIPQSQPGERPYYSELYHKLGAQTVQGDEFLRVISQLIKASNTCYTDGQYSRVDGGQNHWFEQNEKLQKAILGIPLAQLQRAETWETRTKLHRDFSAQVLPYAEEAVKAGFRIFRGRAERPSFLVPFNDGVGRAQLNVLKDNPDSFLVPSEGLFIHVWASHCEARRFMTGFKNLTQRLQELRIDTITTPYSELFMIHTVSVTVTPLVPLVDLSPLDPVSAPVLELTMELLDQYCRSRVPLRLHCGGDGRYYLMNPTGALLVTGESNGERSNLCRPELFDHAPQAGNTPHILEEAVIKAVDKATAALKADLNAKGEEAEGVLNLKIQQLVLEGVVGKVLRKHGVGMGSMYHVLQSEHAQGPGVEAVLREAVIAEMVCRTMKEIFRSEIQLTPYLPDQTQSYANASNFIVELLNRCLYNLMVRPELWDSHFLDVLRSKFRTPDSFVIPQNAVTKRLIIAYLTTRLGTIFEGGKFTKISHIGVSNTLPKPCETTKLILSGKRNEANEAVLNRWKKIQDIRSPVLNLCSMIHQCTLLAQARSSSLDWNANILRLKAEEFNDPLVNTIVRNILVECLGELPETAKFTKALEEYKEEHLTKLMPIDFVYGAEKARALAVQHHALFRGRERETYSFLLKHGTSTLLKECLKGYNPDILGASFKPLGRSMYVSVAADQNANAKATLARNTTTNSDLGQMLTSQNTAGNPLSESDNGVLTPLAERKGEAMKFSEDSTTVQSSLTTDHHVTMLCQVLMHLYQEPEGYEVCLDVIKILRACMTTEKRIEQISAALQRFVAASLDLPYTPSKECLEGLYTLAEENSSLHEAYFGDSDQRFQMAILMTASHWGRVPEVLNEMNDQEKKAYAKFEEGSIRINNTLASEQRALLTGEWYVAMTGPACETMMSQGQWAMAQHIIKFGQRALKKESFKSTERRKSLAASAHLDESKMGESSMNGSYIRSTRLELTEEAAHPQLATATKDLFIAIRACEKLQRKFRNRKEREEEERLRLIEEAEKIRQEEERRKNKCNTTLTIGGRVLPMAKQVVEALNGTAKALDVGVTPKLRGIGGAKPYKLHHGLRLLLCVAPDKKCSSLSAAMMQSGIFPSIKWSVTPAGTGFRSLAVMPTSEALGTWWNCHWLQLADCSSTEAKAALFAKVAANYIYSQYKYTFLMWVINGHGFAGMIAQYLATLLPTKSIEALITFGSPGAFHWPVSAQGDPEFPPVPNTHVCFEEDIIPRLIGTNMTKMTYRRLMSRLEGLGAILPFPIPIKEVAEGGWMTRFIYNGPHLHEITRERGEAADGSDDFYKYKDWQEPRSRFDVRAKLGFTPDHYLTIVARSNGKVVDVKPLDFLQPYTDGERLWTELIDRIGEPQGPELENMIFIPPTVEEIACTPEKLLLAYPKLADTIAKEMASIPDTYGLEMMEHVDLVDDMEHCVDVDQLADVLSAYVGSSWDARWISKQMFEWSGAGNLVHAANQKEKEKKSGKATNEQSRARRRKSSIYTTTISSKLVEDFVAKHNVFFAAAPFTTKHADKFSGPAREGTPTYMDGVKEKERKLMQGADGYHLGWGIAIASVSRSSGKSRLVDGLAEQLLNVPPYTHAHKRTEASLQVPTIRLRWTPKPEINGQGYPIFLQVHYQEVRFDGKMAAKTLLRTAAQVVWIVSDMYTFQRTVKEADIGQRAFHVFVYIPKNNEKPDSAVVQELKQFCLARSFPFAIVEFDREESIESLQKLLFAWMTPSFHFPLNPMQLPPAVEVGALHTRDDDAVQAYVDRVVDPGKFARDPLLTSVTAQRKAVNQALEPVLNPQALQAVQDQHNSNHHQAPPQQPTVDPLQNIHKKAEEKKQKKQEDEKDPVKEGMRAAAKAAREEFEREEKAETNPK